MYNILTCTCFIHDVPGSGEVIRAFALQSVDLG